MFGNIYRGMSYLLEGFGLIIKPGIKRYFLIPLVINLLVFSVLTWIGISYFGDLLNWLLPAEEEWWATLSHVVLWLVFAATALFVLFFTFSIVANLIASPFNALLVAKIEELRTGIKNGQTPGVQGTFIIDVSASVLNELRKILYFVLLGGLIFIFSLLPVANIIFPFVWLVFGSWMLSLEYLGYPMENNGLKFREVRKRAGRRLTMSLGFGLAVMILTMLPLVNFVIMPAAVAGATVMWTDM